MILISIQTKMVDIYYYIKQYFYPLGYQHTPKNKFTNANYSHTY